MGEIKPINLLISPIKGVYCKGKVAKSGNGYHVYVSKEFKDKKVLIVVDEGRL